MNEFEDRLRQAPLAAPSGALDRRMEAAFANASGIRRSSGGPMRPWMLISLGALCGIAATLLFLPARRVRPGEGRVAAVDVRHGAPSAHFVRLLLEPGARQRPLPNFTVSISTH